MDKKPKRYFRITLKGIALVAAIETGLLPEIEKDGKRGYDNELFNRFWDEYNKNSERFRRVNRMKDLIASICASFFASLITVLIILATR